MILNAATMTREEFATYMIYDYNGNEIQYCSIFDTDEGYAECAFAVPSGFKTEDDTLKYRPLFSRDCETYEYTVHTYTLHSFVIKNIKTNEIVAKV
jgi:hypothetical protein